MRRVVAKIGVRSYSLVALDRRRRSPGSAPALGCLRPAPSPIGLRGHNFNGWLKLLNREDVIRAGAGHRRRGARTPRNEIDPTPWYRLRICPGY